MSQPKGVPSKAAMFGHALHPILVDFPIAFLIGAFLTDVGYWRTTEEFWARASVWLIGGGILIGIAAAILGAIDFFTVVPDKAKRSGWIHFIVNVLALTLALLNILLRGDCRTLFWDYFVFADNIADNSGCSLLKLVMIAANVLENRKSCSRGSFCN